MPAVALTDDNLSGAMRFARACAARGIKPILGARLRVGAAPPPGMDDHIIVLARNAEGYANLRTLVTHAHLDPPESERPRLHPGILASHTTGLIALVGGSGGRIAGLLADGDLAGAQEAVQTWTRLFGEGDLYLELGAGDDQGGLDMADADLMRRAMGKRDPKAIEPFRAAFFQGARANGIAPQAAGEILHWLEDVAAHTFSKAHAVSYATLAYRMAYLKTNQPEACDREEDDGDSDVP